MSGNSKNIHRKVFQMTFEDIFLKNVFENFVSTKACRGFSLFNNLRPGIGLTYKYLKCLEISCPDEKRLELSGKV